MPCERSLRQTLKLSCVNRVHDATAGADEQGRDEEDVTSFSRLPLAAGYFCP
jgi:hypothetical protein